MRTEVSVPKLFAVVFIPLLLAVGCGGGGSSNSGSGSGGTPPNPTLNLIATPPLVTRGSSATLVWSSSNATSCTASGGWSGSKATSGSASTGAITSSAAFTLTCSGASGTTAVAETVHVTLTTPNPSLSLRASPPSVTHGSSTTLTWSSSNATSCTASGGWSGNEATSGTMTETPTATTTYTLTCSGASGTTPAVASATVTVAAPSLACVAESVTLAQQVQNPVSHFGTDSNGVILELPTVGASGAATVSGSLVIGIGTRSNNGLNGATRLDGDLSTGDVAATLTGDARITSGFLDSGSNAFFFADNALPVCTSPVQGFYCPPSTVNETALLTGTNATSLAADFSVANADNLVTADPSFRAFNDLAGSIPADLGGGFLDLGLSFFFGRNVFTGIEPANGATAPYFAYGGTQSIAATGPPNVEPLIVDGGPSGLPTPTVNVPYISVTLCLPGTTTCQTIDHVTVDTGSVGLRLMSSVITISLPALTDASGHPFAECLQFASGTTWGSVVTADVKLPTSGEHAATVNVQLIGASSVGSPPAGCTGTAINSVDTFGANGIIGVGPFVNDCNAAGDCAPGVQGANYYYCTD
jgi:Protein of unknown function (DUF3443)